MGVLVPTMTFAATAAVVRYQGAVPILVDCDPVTFNMSLDDAERNYPASATINRRAARRRGAGGGNDSRSRRLDDGHG